MVSVARFHLAYTLVVTRDGDSPSTGSGWFNYGCSHLFRQRHGSGDDAPCAAYPGTDCWRTFHFDLSELSRIMRLGRGVARSLGKHGAESPSVVVASIQLGLFLPPKRMVFRPGKGLEAQTHCSWSSEAPRGRCVGASSGSGPGGAGRARRGAAPACGRRSHRGPEWPGPSGGFF